MILSIILVILYKVRAFIPVLSDYEIFPIFRLAHLMLMGSIPILLLLPEDNWIWLVEEDPRTRKISLRSKAVKHTHLSMLYMFWINYPFFLLTTSLIIIYHPHPYEYQLTMVFVAMAFAYGVYSAWKNYINVQKYESLFAVGWDRRSLFFEIYVGLKVAREPYFFYSGLSLLAAIILFGGSVVAPPLFFRYFGQITTAFDQEKRLVMTMMFHFFLVLGIWSTTMYFFFQLLFSRKLERWSREPRQKYISGE